MEAINEHKDEPFLAVERAALPGSKRTCYVQDQIIW